MTYPEITIGRDLLGRDVLPDRGNRRQAAVLTQPGAAEQAEQVAAALRCDAKVIQLPDGEAAKTLFTAEEVFRELNAHGLTRHDTIVAVGGGAITDLGGFVAATYLRGIEAVYCPTTLLGAVDAAIGGKTGVNVGGKNLVGVFSHPSRVVIDIDVLERLPRHLLSQGMAEALKAGLVGDPGLVDLLQADGLDADLELVVRRAVAVKTGIVEEDFREAGRRAVLNYGHTVGHAVEVAAGLSHGEAVAVGMVAAGRLSAELVGFEDEARVVDIISQLGLPTGLALPGDLTPILELVQLDKKRDAESIRMVLLKSVGVPVVSPVDEARLEAALRSVSSE